MTIPAPAPFQVSLLLSHLCAVCPREASHITPAGTPVCDACWNDANLAGTPEGKEVVPLRPVGSARAAELPPSARAVAPTVGTRPCGSKHARYFRFEPLCGHMLCTLCYAADYPIRPLLPCPRCGHSAWQERPAANGGGWYCGCCH